MILLVRRSNVDGDWQGPDLVLHNESSRRPRLERP